MDNFIEKKVFDNDGIKRIAHQILVGLDELHQKNIVHRNLSCENILLQQNCNDIKLFNYGLYYATDNGNLVSFPIMSVHSFFSSNFGKFKHVIFRQVLYTAPEVYLDDIAKSLPNPKVDIWSLGIILAELTLNKHLWSSLKLGQRIRKVLSLVQSEGSIFERIAREHSCIDKYTVSNTD